MRKPHGTGPPIVRPDWDSPPCDRCPKVPDDVPVRTRFARVELDDAGWLAYRHYKRCKAVGHFPDDEMVQAVATIVEDVQQAVAEQRQREAMQQGITLAVLTLANKQGV